MPRPRKEPKKAEWRLMPEVRPIIEELVKKWHKHLERAEVVVLGKPKAGKRLGKRVEVTVRKPTAAMKAMLIDVAAEPHYLVEVGLDLWGELDQRGKRRVLDRALCHFTGLDDKGAWQLVGPDVSEFTDILRRWGPYNADLELFVKAARQMDLPLEGEAT